MQQKTLNYHLLLIHLIYVTFSDRRPIALFTRKEREDGQTWQAQAPTR